MEAQEVTLKDRHGRDHVVLLDAVDAHLIERHTWRICRNGYPHRKTGNQFIYLHRVIVEATAGQLVDHVNGDPLDNRRENLRVCSKGENTANQRIQLRNKSGFKGVQRRGSSWVAAIGFRGEQFYLGSFSDPRVAAHAYNRAAVRLHGDFARLNPL